MENITATNATEVPTRRFGGYSATTLAAFATVLAAGLWSGWATDKLLDLQKREVVTVELSTIMDDFVEAEARSGRSPEDMKRRVEQYLAAIQASVETLGREGRTVLVAEAVVAGSTPDLTDVVRADVGKRMESRADAKR